MLARREKKQISHFLKNRIKYRIKDKEGVRSKWKKYFTNLLNFKDDRTAVAKCRGKEGMWCERTREAGGISEQE